MIIKFDVAVTHSSYLNFPVRVFETKSLVYFGPVEKFELDLGCLSFEVFVDLNNHM
jgi:hypothetical protein